MELWKNIKGYEGIYQVSNKGRVKAISREWISGNGAIKTHGEIILRQHKTKGGYLVVPLTKNGQELTKKVHRLVAETFIPNPMNKPQVNHKNGIKMDNRLDNLEWVTSSENLKHSYKIGLSKTGDNWKMAVATRRKRVRITNGSQSLEFDSAAEAGRHIGCGARRASAVATGKSRSVYGWTIEYI